MGKILADFFLEQSFKIMVSGFLIMSVGIVFLFKIQHQKGPLERIAFGITAFGVAVWLFGRICIVLQRRRLRKQRIAASRDQYGSES